MMCHFQITALAMTLGGALGTSAQTDQADDLRSVLEKFQEAYDFPEATAAYALSDGTIVSAAVGYSDIEASLLMLPDSRMLAASIGKTVWGALV